MARGWGRTQVRAVPEGKIRQSQVVTTFGPGAMVDLIDQAVLVGGLDFWAYGTGNKAETIQEPRLRDAVAERFQQAGRELALELAFREPPVGDDKTSSPGTGIKVFEFPQWFVCQGPECRALLQPNGLERKSGRYMHQCSRARLTECVPVRFVLACRRGHIQDFPWVWFVHERRDRERCAAPSLRLLEGATGDFSEIEVQCACGGRDRLSGALSKESNPQCRGERPWLGPEGREECEEHLRLLVRTASNSYFSQVVSALSVPDKGKELEDAIRRVWDVMKAATRETLPAFRSIDKVKAALGDTHDTDVLAAVQSIKDGAPAAQEPLRTAEFRQFVSQKTEARGELPQHDDLFFARRCATTDKLPPKIASLVLAHKLREVRVQVGFTRIEPVTPDLQGEYDVGVQAAALGLTTNWLPASEVRGEGVFIQFDETAVREWEDRPEVLKRGKDLLAGYDAWAKPLGDKAPPFPGVRFYMLHSLAHLLTSAIALECGYAASAIRERIYCAPATDDVPMAAILLSTGSTGTEGTLGGLVEQGRRLGQHLRHAYDLGVLCSYDPVCAAHSPKDDPSERHLEGAACHGCLFIAESSCEWFNRYLDRALVVPTIGHPAELAFFPERP